MGLIGFIFFTVFICIDKTFSTSVLISFFLGILSAFFLLLEDAANYYFQLKEIRTDLYPWFAAIGFSLRVATVGFTASITNRTTGKFHRLIYVLMIINAAFAFLSIKFGLYFTFSEDGVWYYSKGLLVLPYLISAFFVAIIFQTAISHFMTNKLESAIVLTITITSVIANLLEMFSIQRLALAQNFIASIIFYYLTLNIQIYKHDPLTNVLNRRSFFSESLKLAAHRTMIVFMDMNDLKKLNDTYGHAKGDKALVSVSEKMVESFKSLGRIYRIGGDEFIALLKIKSLDEILKAIEQFKNSLRKTPYSVALGYTEFRAGENFEEKLAEADKLMYENKRKMKTEQEQNGTKNHHRKK